MNRITPVAVALGGFALLASCTTAPAEQARNPKAANELADALAERVAGKPERCIDSNRSVQIEVIDERTILYRDGRTIYVQNPPGGCRGLGGGYTLVTRPFGSQLCDRDINNLVDLRTGMRGPTCTFGPFIPYRKAS